MKVERKREWRKTAGCIWVALDLGQVYKVAGRGAGRPQLPSRAQVWPSRRKGGEKRKTVQKNDAEVNNRKIVSDRYWGQPNLYLSLFLKQVFNVHSPLRRWDGNDHLLSWGCLTPGVCCKIPSLHLSPERNLFEALVLPLFSSDRSSLLAPVFAYKQYIVWKPLTPIIYNMKNKHMHKLPNTKLQSTRKITCRQGSKYINTHKHTSTYTTEIHNYGIHKYKVLNKNLFYWRQPCMAQVVP